MYLDAVLFDFLGYGLIIEIPVNTLVGLKNAASNNTSPSNATSTKASSNQTTTNISSVKEPAPKNLLAAFLKPNNPSAYGLEPNTKFALLEQPSELTTVRKPSVQTPAKNPWKGPDIGADMYPPEMLMPTDKPWEISTTASTTQEHPAATTKATPPAPAPESYLFRPVSSTAAGMSTSASENSSSSSPLSVFAIVIFGIFRSWDYHVADPSHPDNVHIQKVINDAVS